MSYEESLKTRDQASPLRLDTDAESLPSLKGAPVKDCIHSASCKTWGKQDDDGPTKTCFDIVLEVSLISCVRMLAWNINLCMSN